MLTGSLADENGGAYASSRSASPAAAIPADMAVAMTSIRLSTPVLPTICAPRMVPSVGSKMSFADMRVAPG